ncbi:MAG: Rieske (2Fe-2S) protein [Bacteroidota bacterium]|nr:Rieske (2Fe-2S) protein [Candidatus Kapabacteria bacterium]MDW8220353.1 Rieske (2Fe-2S) protein [Bacteroidota bacterium]
MNCSSCFQQRSSVESTPGQYSAERREFLYKAASMLGITISAGACISLVPACEQTQVNTSSGMMGTGSATLDIASQSALQRVGGAVRIALNNTQLVIIRTSMTEFLALSAVCTHAGCLVNLPVGGTLSCDCHGSQFSATDGRVLNGPAAVPLRRYTTSFNSMTNILTITF